MASRAGVLDPEVRKARALDRVHRSARALRAAEEAYYKAVRQASEQASRAEVAAAAGQSKSHINRVVWGEVG